MNSEKKAEAHGMALLAGERPRDSLEAKIWDIAHAGMTTERQKRDDEKAVDAAAKPEPISETIDEPEEPVQPLTVQRSLPLEARLRSAARELQSFDEHGVFTSNPLSPQNEFPTSLTRLPIFRPSHRKKQQSIQDLDNAVPFDTPYGSGRRLGPPLTIRDEDTLIALMRLRDRVLTGPKSQLPVNVRDIYTPKTDKTEVHRVVCTIDQINTELGLSDAGNNFKNTLASVKRLNASKIELDNILADGSRVGGAFDLIKVQWHVYDRHGLVDVIFPPLMAHWLRHSYTFIDWKTRLQLSALGKAIHRYLSGQRHNFAIELNKLAVTIGHDGRKEHSKRNFQKACDELVAVNWLSDFEIKGNGRSKPHVLYTYRESKKSPK